MKTLCNNCDNNHNCLWMNDNVVQCNEHQMKTIESTNTGIEQTHLNLVHTSLCSTCDFEPSCTFKHKNLNTIYCEEYQ